MAKKSRTPPPPRRVQAPKQRRGEAPADRRRRLMLVGGAAALIAVIAAGAVVAAVVLGGGSSADAAIREAGCTLEKKPAQGRNHVEEIGEDFEYNTFPPTTGPHHPASAVWDFYAEPVEQFRLVHNLEHGGVVVQYGEDVPQATVDQIRDWYLDDPNGLAVAPLPELGDKVAFGAWTAPDARPGEEPRPGEGVLATCPGFDPEVADTFADEYGFRGPERLPREELRPGA